MKTKKTNPKAAKASRLFDSMSQAASAMELPTELLKRAKARGCPAFRPGGRVDEVGLREWLAAHGDEITEGDTKLSLQIEKLREEVRKLRLVNDERDGVLVEKSKVIDAIQRAGAAWHSERLRMEAEWPAKLAGIVSVPEMASKVKEQMDRVSAVLNGLGREFQSL